MFSEWVCEHVGVQGVVAVAEPIASRRERVAERHQIPAELQFTRWQDLLAQPKLADILLNTTMDQDHLQSSTQAMRLGYHMLLEKPMATSLRDCAEIDQVRAETNRIVSVCHSLRYHSIYTDVRRIVRSGIIGDVVAIDQLEAVEHIHMSHSFVRGNWGNESRSTFMLLAKSCHDIDILADLVDKPCERVSSFGDLTYFKESNAPTGAPKYCVEGCPVESSCPYHALKIYGPGSHWRYHSGFDGLDQLETIEALRTSPYGRCVFQADNDVVDHQVVAMEFEGGITVTFTMAAFTPFGGRYLRIHGTKGYLEAKVDQRTIDVWEFWQANRHSHIDIPAEAGHHGGADNLVIRSLIDAVASEDPMSVLTSTSESLRTHAIVFAAETARRERRIVEIREIFEQLSEPVKSRLRSVFSIA